MYLYKNDVIEYCSCQIKAKEKEPRSHSPSPAPSLKGEPLQSGPLAAMEMLPLKLQKEYLELKKKLAILNKRQRDANLGERGKVLKAKSGQVKKVVPKPAFERENTETMRLKSSEKSEREQREREEGEKMAERKKCEEDERQRQREREEREIAERRRFEEERRRLEEKRRQKERKMAAERKRREEEENRRRRERKERQQRERRKREMRIAEFEGKIRSCRYSVQYCMGIYKVHVCIRQTAMPSV